jgi:hypothetical protein
MGTDFATLWQGILGLEEGGVSLADKQLAKAAPTKTRAGCICRVWLDKLTTSLKGWGICAGFCGGVVH